MITLAEGAETAPDDALPLRFIEAMPVGVPADPATAETVTKVVIEMTACARDNDPLRLLALFTDAYVRAIANEQESLIVNIEATPVSRQPVNADLRVVAIQDVLHLDDGRVSAVVTVGGVEDSHPAPGRTGLVIFVERDGQWLVDAQHEEVWPGDPATPPVAIADLITTSATPVASPQATPRP